MITFDEAKFRDTNPRVLEHQKSAMSFMNAMRRQWKLRLCRTATNNTYEGIVDPISGTKNWTEVRQFNLMFSTEMGASADASTKIYLRPETAQGIFVNFLNVQKTGRMKLPFGNCSNRKSFSQRDSSSPICVPNA